MLKYFQMAPDAAREGLYEFDYDIKSSNHAIVTCTHCHSLFYFERKGSQARYTQSLWTWQRRRTSLHRNL